MIFRKSLLFFLFFSAALSAHSKDKNNWVINLKGDTIRARMYIDMRDKYDHDRIRVKADSGKFTMMPWQIKRAHLNGFDYIPIKLNQKQQFGEVVSEGFLSLYHVRGTDGETSTQFIQKVLVKRTGEQLMVSLLTFKRVTKKFLEDCVVNSKVEEAGNYKIKNIQEIVNEYNSCMDNRTVALFTKEDVDKDIADFKVLIQRIRESQIADKEDLVEMINDVQGKVNIGKNVPTYLINSIHSILNQDDKLSQEFNKLLEKYNR
ncbi:hypothetical protein [Reichenbachiella versicolor]|uniref:hypothetical protein n=1 Tax=Reichenbachiella versicolor TaxID=1821036 RepID=UPI000D6E1EAF|nr:hypothetical protein [Reichenbachiella versicolor]